MTDTKKTSEVPIQVGLFVTCLADLVRPKVAFAAVRLLEQAGCTVTVPRAQTCCGQPALNSGDQASTERIAQGVIRAFADFDYVVAPSGSCTGTLRHKYPELFRQDLKWATQARALADKTFELTRFLVEVMKIEQVKASYAGTCTYHDSCAGLREMNVHEQPRRLLQGVTGLTLTEMVDANVCCGFGGLFSVKYPDISVRMVSDKCANVASSGADTLLGGDLGCLLNIAGRLRREDSPVKVLHVAEVLAGMAEGPGIGEPESDS
ncbi:MAG: (Fe-S)-binding protein [Arenicellales bacterium]|nr:Fe-S oxidoreductase [Pseudomonadota bacterium]MDP6141357.1 (Fe-S)-binding protein [Arenicellales bacterium]HCV20224.1 Fe-S oxidoreductase [Gammaproteobacteria bacterium]MDP6314045.1 (Fe-S)-binding protein [Arenicellales bacterium]MDP7119264.1 (Fe-S)-binding protein [Arenicellales bacterium]